MGQLVLTLAEEDKKQSEGGGKRTRRRGETCLCLLLLLDCLSSLSRTEKLQMLGCESPGEFKAFASTKLICIYLACCQAFLIFEYPTHVSYDRDSSALNVNALYILIVFYVYK